MGPAFQTLASRFSLLKLRIYVQFQQDTEQPSFKGSMLHGWFGHAIKAVDEHAFFILYGNHENLQPKPYIVRPNEDLKTQWRKNEIYHFDIILVGDAIRFGESVVEACRYGQKLGLGPKRTPFSLISLCSITPYALKAGLHSTQLSDWLIASPVLEPQRYDGEPQRYDGEPQVEIAIHYQTPIRLKSAGNIIKNRVPGLDEWLNHIIRRWKTLSEFWVTSSDELFNQLYQELPLLGDYETHAHLYFEDWQRYSHKERNHLPFGGLKGQVSYFGDISPSVPWLMVGQQLHIGGKTTFGLGYYDLIS